MIVNRDRQGLLGVVLADAAKIQLPANLRRFGHVQPGLLLFGLRCQFLIEHLLAENDAVVADKNSRTGDQLFDFGMGLAAKTAQRDIGRSGHGT